MLTKLNSFAKNKDNSYSNLIIFEIMNNIKIKSALISVFSKEGIAPIVDELVENKVKLYSTGGTYKYISKLGYDVIEVENITDYPSIFGGRVKTLHPKIHSGILSDRDNKKHMRDLKDQNFEEIDLVICATVTPDMLFPSTAAIIIEEIGAENAFGFDLSAACSGFLFALKTGSSYIESGACKKVIIVGADKMSSIVDYTDRQTCVIFGDGAGAVLLESTKSQFGILDTILKVDGSGQKYLKQIEQLCKKHGSTYHMTVLNERWYEFKGKNLWKFIDNEGKTQQLDKYVKYRYILILSLPFQLFLHENINIPLYKIHLRLMLYRI